MIEELNKLTQELTAFTSFREMCNTTSNYRPTLIPRGVNGRKFAMLANAYDLVMEVNGDKRRAYRGVERQTFTFIKLREGDYDVYDEQGAYLGRVWNIGYGKYPWRNQRDSAGCHTRQAAAERMARLKRELDN